MKNFEKLIDIIKIYIKGGDFNSVKLTFTEKIKMKELLDEFTFLYSHSSDKSLYLAEKLKTAFDDKLFFVNAFFEKTSQFNELSDSVKNKLKENTYCMEFYPVNLKSMSRLYKYYKKKDDVIEVYEGIKMNDEAVFIYYKNDTYGIGVPYFIKESNVENLISGGYAEIDGEKLRVFSTYKLMKTINLLKQKVDENKKFIKKFHITYSKDGDLYVCDACYKDNFLKNWINLEKKLIGPNFLIVDKNGKSLETDEINYSQIIKKMRDAISHGNNFNLKIPITTTFDLNVSALILKSKTEPNNKFKCAVLCLNDLIRFLGYNCCISLCCGDDKYRFAMFPNLKSMILNEKQLEELKNKSCVISVKIENECNELVFINYINDIIKNYSSKGESAINPKVKERIEEKIKERFPDAVIDVEQICNWDLFNAKTINNARFFKKNSQKKNEQELYISNVLNNFYGANFLTSQNNNKIQLKNNGIQNMTVKINEILTQIEKGETVKQKAGFYSFEYEMLLAYLVVYVCLVKNDITDEMNRSNKNPYLKEMVKNTQTKSLEVKIADTNMSCFTFYDANGVQTRKKPNISKEKLNVVKWIKNAICHNGVFLQQPFAKKIDEQVLIFESVGEEGFGKNKAEKIHVVEVKYKDLMNYFLSPTFLEHKKDLNKVTKVANFEELILKIREKIGD